MWYIREEKKKRYEKIAAFSKVTFCFEKKLCCNKKRVLSSSESALLSNLKLFFEFSNPPLYI